MSKKSKRRPERSAQRAYVHALRRHESDLSRAVAAFEPQMRDPDHCESLGLPRELPEFTIDVLSQTQALDRMGPRCPRRDHFGPSSVASSNTSN